MILFAAAPAAEPEREAVRAFVSEMARQHDRAWNHKLGEHSGCAECAAWKRLPEWARDAPPLRAAP